MLVDKITKKLFGTQDEREVKKMRKIVDKINAIEPQFQNYTDGELSAKTAEFKERLEKGETLDDILVEAFATVREAARRILGMRAYDVQLIGGMILHSGNIAEMKTGEGKTLMSTMPIYLNALTGKGVHVVTVNDYLAKRDRDLMSEMFEFLGLTSGVIVANIPNDARKRAYDADITYGTNNEFGFDYLRDNMVGALEEKVQRKHNFAIVDEIDSILIDEARTPLIISGAAEETTEWYNTFAEVAKRLKRSYKTEEIKDKKNTVIPDEDWEDYEVDEKSHTVTITDKGIRNVEKMLKIDNLYSPEYVELTHFLTQALKAKELFKLDRDYIINEKGEVIRMKEALMSDAISTATGALVGTSTVTTLVESSSGIAAGGRTGLTALTTALMFLASIIFAPIVTIIPNAATSPALIFVGVLMLSNVKDIDFSDITDAVPAFCTIVFMPFTYSIANGIALGLITYCILKIFTGQGEKIKALTWVVSIIFILRYAFITLG